jgi:hypothetical protein
MPRLILCCVAMMMAASAHTVPAAARDDFRSIIPSDWKRVLPSQGSNELKFISPDGDSKIVFYAKLAALPVAGMLRGLRTVHGGNITYERQGRTWIVVSGFFANRIFYRKAMLACDGTVWHYMEFEYPAAQKRVFDELVTRSSAALGVYARSGCRG